MNGRFLSALLVATAVPASAQTLLIPDEDFQVMLWIAYPAAMDTVSGALDTVIWNAANVTLQVDMDLVHDADLNLAGLDLINVAVLKFQSDSGWVWGTYFPGYPGGIETLILEKVDPYLIPGLTPFPVITYFTCDSCGLTSIPSFGGVVQYLTFLNCDLGGPALTIPAGTVFLQAPECGITVCPVFPPGIVHLNLNRNQIPSFPAFPISLWSLYIRENTAITSMPVLPSDLRTLDVSMSGITQITGLPTTLLNFFAEGSPVLDVLDLPANLGQFDAESSGLTMLPPLPPDLFHLEVDNCPITSLPALPADLLSLRVDGCLLTSLPALNDGLVQLHCQGNTGLTCLPVLPGTLNTLRVGGSGITCLPNIPASLVPYLGGIQIPPVVCDPGISPCAPVDPTISGLTFNDVDGDGVLDAGEPVRPASVVMASPGNLLAGSGSDGHYNLLADIGTYTVSGQAPLYHTVTTTPTAITFTALGEVDSLNHVGYQAIPGMYDLVTTVAGTNVRPGFNTGVWVHVRNVGTEPTSASVVLVFDPALTYNTSSVVPNSINGNAVYWTTAVIVPGGSWTVWVELYAPPSLILGSPVVQQATATPSLPDQTPTDNTYVLNDVVVGSFDPNDKHVEPDYLTLSDVASGTRVSYTVRFQNTGTFTAERVLITDTLSSDLQWATMSFTASSHACTWYIHNGVLHVLFENINLPDSTSDEPGSHGFVKFSFVASTSLIIGDAVDNVANIYFDFNAPVITNAATFYVETGLGVQEGGREGLRAWPNPADDVLMIASDGVLTGTMEVLDITGRVLMVKRSTGVRTSLDIGALVAGPYLVRCNTVDGTRTLQFVKH